MHLCCPKDWVSPVNSLIQAFPNTAQPLSHTYPLFLIFHQHFLQCYLLACLTMFGFENFPVKTEINP